MTLREKRWHHERFVAEKGLAHRAVAEAVAAAGATEEIDFNDGLFHQLTLDENVTLTFANEPDDTTVVTAYIKFTQDGAGTNTVTWPANVDWAGGSAPTITSTGDAVDIVELIKYPGDNWVGRVIADIS